MRVFPGYAYHIYVGDKELKNILQFRVVGNKVHVDREYSYRGFCGADLLGISTDTYDLSEVTIFRRGKHELHSEEDKE